MILTQNNLNRFPVRAPSAAGIAARELLSSRLARRNEIGVCVTAHAVLWACWLFLTCPGLFVSIAKTVGGFFGKRMLA
jgi:hypothetical protein